MKPTLDNRYGDFRLPATDQRIGPEARLFRHAIESGDTSAWPTRRILDGDMEPGELAARFARKVR